MARPPRPGGRWHPHSVSHVLWHRRRPVRHAVPQPPERYADLVQLFPASESHHHAYPGNMLDHGLEIVAYALKLRQSHLLPAGATPEAQTAQAEAWTADRAVDSSVHARLCDSPRFTA